MSYDMNFQGTLEYPHEPALRAAVAAFEADGALDESVVSRRDLQIAGTHVRVRVSGSAPASWWDSTCGAIATLAEPASAGHVDCEYDGGEGEDSIYRVRLHAGGEEEELDAP
jgi:hypothetical protein